MKGKEKWVSSDWSGVDFSDLLHQLHVAPATFQSIGSSQLVSKQHIKLKFVNFWQKARICSNARNPQFISALDDVTPFKVNTGGCRKHPQHVCVNPLLVNLAMLTKPWVLEVPQRSVNQLSREEASGSRAALEKYFQDYGSGVGYVAWRASLWQTARNVIGVFVLNFLNLPLPFLLRRFHVVQNNSLLLCLKERLMLIIISNSIKIYTFLDRLLRLRYIQEVNNRKYECQHQQA